MNMGPIRPFPLNYNPPTMTHRNELWWDSYFYYRGDHNDELLNWLRDNLGKQAIGLYIPTTNIWVGIGNWRYMTTLDGWFNIWLRKRYHTLFKLTWL